MAKLNLKRNEIKELENLHKQMKDKKMADRVKVVIAIAKGYTYAQIEEILLVDEEVVAGTKNCF